MSYIIAFVSYSNSEAKFPVQCLRTDLFPGDEVVVRRGDGQLRLATIIQFGYLNWDCKGRIECKKTERILDAQGGYVLPRRCPLNFGLSSTYALVNELKSEGWVPVNTRFKTCRAVLANVNFSNVSYIFVRKNYIDIQVLDRVHTVPVLPYSWYESSLNEGRVVRHYLAHTTFNLFEGIMRFSHSFLNNEDNLDRYFVSQGSTDKRTSELKKRAEDSRTSRDEMVDIYSASSDGDGGAAYLGDGVWISSDGGLHDWGR